MSKADEMNLVEAVSLLKEMQDNALIACRCYKTSGILYRDEKAEQKVNAIETALNYIENSIPKQLIENKLEDLQKEYKEALEENSIKAFILKCQIEGFKDFEKELLHNK